MDNLLDVIEHPDKEKYGGQKIFIVEFENYVYLVLFVEDEEKIFLKTIIPSRNATKKYLGRLNMMKKLNKEEKELLEFYDKNEWQSLADFKEKKSKYTEYARNMFLKNKRKNILISEHDLMNLKMKSLEEGIPYQTLISSILHKYISGKLVENQ